MKFNRYYLVIEFFIILVYLLMNLFSIIIFPINLILGFICILFLPGYNLVKLIRPNSNLMEKLGYSTIFSLAIENITMFILYIGFYDCIQKSGRYAFIFWPEFLILIIQIINISLILIDKFLNKDRRKEIDINRIFKLVKKNFDLKSILIIAGFIYLLVFLCISSFFSQVPNNDYHINHIEYESNFTFFLRVPFYFYFFLIGSIVFFVYILFYSKSKYLILFCTSAFLYCLWILPYLQIKNYVSADMNMFRIIYENYCTFGINALNNCSFTVKYHKFNPIRYSTSLFTSILITNGFGVDIDFALMFLYQLIFIFIPFLFYSIFQRFSENKNVNDISLRILMILVILSTSFIKSARTPTTAIIGSITFIILVLEYYKFIEAEDKKLRELFIFIFLYFFLTLTHLEECIYFLLLIPVYTICYLFFKLRESPEDKKLKDSSRKLILIMGSLLLILSINFILIQEFFCALNYFFLVFKDIPIIEAIYYLYVDTKIVLIPIMGGNYLISPIIIGLIIIGISGSSILLYLFASKFFHILIAVYNKLTNIVIRIHNLVKKLISMKVVQIAIPIIIFSVIILINLFYPFIELKGLMILVEIILSYSIITLNIFLFIKGIPHYKAQNNRQNYFLILIGFLFILLIFLAFGDIDLAYYHLNSRIVTFFIFFNLMIIQNNYFMKFINKRKKYLIILLFLLISLGSFYSLRKLAYG